MQVALSKGVFWFKSLTECENSVIIKAKCDVNGIFIENVDVRFLSKNGLTFNHEKVWESLPKSITDGKMYNHYPRGRVEIKRGQAIIFVNQNIAAVPALVDYIISIFGLNRENDIIDVLVKVDMSKHYLCYMDRFVK